MSWSRSELRVRLAPLNWLKPSGKTFYWPFQGGTSFVDLLCFFCLVFAMPLCVSVYMCLVVTCWERADPLALVCGVYCEFVTFPLVSWVRCGTWLYRVLIFAPLLTFMALDLRQNFVSAQYLENKFHQRGSCMVWEINMGVCPRLEFDNIMFINCLGYDFYIYGAFEFLCNSISNLWRHVWYHYNT